MVKDTDEKVKSWRWRMVKACGTMEKFCEQTGRTQSQVSEWVTFKKVPTEDSVEGMENDLEKLGV